MQWALPQVDIYIGMLSPFSASLNFTVATTRSNATGGRLYRHSEPNGGPRFGSAKHRFHRDEVQVQEEYLL